MLHLVETRGGKGCAMAWRRLDWIRPQESVPVRERGLESACPRPLEEAVLPGPLVVRLRSPARSWHCACLGLLPRCTGKGMSGMSEVSQDENESATDTVSPTPRSRKHLRKGCGDTGYNAHRGALARDASHT